MTRHIHNLEAYSKANAKTILSKVQEVVTNEMNRSNLFNHTNNNPNDNTTNDSHDSCATTQSSSQEHSQEPSQQQSKSQQSQQPPFFQLKELRFGRIIGRGGFCIVRELNEIQLMQSSTSNGDASSRQQLANQVGASSSSNHNSRQTKRKQQQRRYVVKQVDPNTTNRIHLLKGTIDIAFEIKYLASFQHRNIISVRGISSDDYNTNDRSDASNNTIDNNTDHSNGSNRIYYPAVTPEKKIIGTYSTRYSNINEYFIIMEQLDDILNKKLYHWMKLHRTTLGVTGYITSSMEALCCSCKNTNPSMTRSMKLLVERLFVAYDISDAMNYLHSKNIIYRDLVSL